MRLMLMGAGLTMMLLGCGSSSGPELIDVSGEVSYQSEPIQDGVIKFVPTQGSQAPRRTAAIKEGEYDASGRGALGVGTYKIEIMAYSGEPADTKSYPVSDAESEKKQAKPREQILPDKYNTKSEIEELTIESGSKAITKNFNLE
ncbi:hypothetical protein [Gimesia fumaroli]|uniref:Carboxypeptidase regulatory-like domain-containing protein n=1 Tax=Gimesia fumaroli TaxID=2527976 RepID=A0A518I9B0_9PLAN|nr:hypothetical protein [Gimesia fumaroli]QDV49680.1 hypothetical protein Enr17x_17010 [Gimesia fumaroli]